MKILDIIYSNKKTLLSGSNIDYFGDLDEFILPISIAVKGYYQGGKIAGNIIANYKITNDIPFVRYTLYLTKGNLSFDLSRDSSIVYPFYGSGEYEEYKNIVVSYEQIRNPTTNIFITKFIIFSEE